MTSNLSKKQKKLAKSIKVCLDNAESFLKDAKSLIENGSYGHSFSLAILGGEETAKALYLRYAYRGASNMQDLRKWIYDHRAKQRGLLALRAIVDVVVHIFEDKFGVKIKDIDGDKIAKLSDEELSSLDQKGYEEMKNLLASSEKSKKLEKAKQKGFYVDINDDGSLISSPSQVSRKEAEDAVLDLFIALTVCSNISRDIIQNE